MQNNTQGVALGIDIGGTNIKFGLVSESGELLAKETAHTPQSKQAADVVDIIVKTTKAMFSSSGIKPAGAGVGAPGMVDAKQEHVVMAPNFPPWNNLPLRSMLSDALGLEIVLDNDVNAFAIAESLWGAGAGIRNFVAAAVGTGVGGGIIIDGKLFRGAFGAAAELGFTVIEPDGPVAGGQPGVLEAFIGRAAFDNEVDKLFPTGEFPTPMRITELANNGDERACKIQSKFAAHLAEAAASWVHILNPEAIIIGGGTFSGADFMMKEFESKLFARILPAHRPGLKVLPGKLGYYAGMQGAAALWFAVHASRLGDNT